MRSHPQDLPNTRAILAPRRLHTGMSHYPTFAEYLERRNSASRNGKRLPPDLLDAPAPRQDPLSDGLFPRGFFKAVNPARPVSPLNSRLLAAPTRKRLKSQVMGR